MFLGKRKKKVVARQLRCKMSLSACLDDWSMSSQWSDWCQGPGRKRKHKRLKITQQSKKNKKFKAS